MFSTISDFWETRVPNIIHHTVRSSPYGPSAFRPHIFLCCPWVPLKALAWRAWCWGPREWRTGLPAALAPGRISDRGMMDAVEGFRHECVRAECDRCFVRTRPGRRIPGSALMRVPSLTLGSVSLSNLGNHSLSEQGQTEILPFTLEQADTYTMQSDFHTTLT